jgi:hypothetical protein
MASSNDQRQWSRSMANRPTRHPIPGRMFNYYEPAPPPRDTDVMSDYRRRGPAPPIPGCMANYLEADHNEAASAHKSPLDQGRTSGKGLRFSGSLPCSENLHLSESFGLNEDPTQREGQASSNLSRNRPAHQDCAECRSSAMHARALMEEEGAELLSLK